MIGKIGVIAAAGALAVAIAGVAVPAGAETTLRAAGPWPKTHPLIQSFHRFIEKTNAAGKGVLQIRYVGGPEITKPREQPTAMRNGLFDLLYGPPAYYLGLFPEGDFANATKTAMEQRAAGAYELIRKAMKEKMNARFIARFDSGLGLHLFLKNEPKRTASDGIDLTGLKLRASPTYRDLIKDLGGTAVVMGPQEVYTALERGVIDGMGYSLTDIRARGVQKFVKYRIDPPFSHATISLVMHHPVWDKMPKKAQEFLDAQAEAWEKESYQYWKDKAAEEEKALAKLGMKTIDLQGKAREEYLATFLKGPWRRMEQNPKVTVDMKELRKRAY